MAVLMERGGSEARRGEAEAWRGVSSGWGAGSQQTAGGLGLRQVRTEVTGPPLLPWVSLQGTWGPGVGNPALGRELGNETWPRRSLLEALAGGRGRGGRLCRLPRPGCYDPNGVTQAPAVGKANRTRLVAVFLSGCSFVCVV